MGLLSLSFYPSGMKIYPFLLPTSYDRKDPYCLSSSAIKNYGFPRIKIYSLEVVRHQFYRTIFYPTVYLILSLFYKEDSINCNSKLYIWCNTDLKQDHLFEELTFRRYDSLHVLGWLNI
jgi:hypothetical protein